MAQGDLVSLAKLKAWLAITSADSAADQVLSTLITQVSAVIRAELDRGSLLRTKRTYYFAGRNNSFVLLPEWPALSVVSMTVGGSTISASNGLTGYGYFLDGGDPEPPGLPGQVNFVGGVFPQSNTPNCAIEYWAGYAQDFSTTITASLTIEPPYGTFARDDGVVRANGVAFVKVSSAPAANQYSVSADGVYTFNAADVGASAIISYSFIPSQLESAAMEFAADRFRYKSRIGEISKTLGGQETAGYEITSIPKFVEMVLRPFRKAFIS